ncbi:MAG: helix-turn-helix transcriptional regulator [Proteobacteria bacterium]|nr:helix-turn-helix transcriptional regulator [Pseudomonadota bacterium]
MAEELSSWVLQGDFGRVTINTTDQGIVEHVHRELNIIFKLSGADTRMAAQGIDLLLDDNSVLLFNPWLPHAKLASPGKPATILSLFIDPGWLAARFSAVCPDRLFADLRRQLSPEIRAQASLFAETIMSHMIDETRRCEAMLVNFLDAIIAAFGVSRAVLPITSAGRPVDYRIRKAVTYIHAHAAENPRVEEIARMVGLSRSRFFEQFTRCVGVSPRHYIDSLRLGIATRWLTANEGPLGELADTLSFGAHSNFTRFFTQHVALSPSEFRRQTITLNRFDDALAQS